MPGAGPRRAEAAPLGRPRGRACCIAAAAAPLGSSLPTMAAPSPSGGGGSGGGSGSGTPGSIGSPAPGHPAVSSMQGKERSSAETPAPWRGRRRRRGLSLRPRTPPDPAEEATGAARACLPPSRLLAPCRPPRARPGSGLRPAQAPAAASACARLLGPAWLPRRSAGPTWPRTAPAATPVAAAAYLARAPPAFAGTRRPGLRRGGRRRRAWLPVPAPLR